MRATCLQYNLLIVFSLLGMYRAPIGEVPITGPVFIKIHFSSKCAQFTSRTCPDSFAQVPCYPSFKQGFILISQAPYYRIALAGDTTQGLSYVSGSIVLDVFDAGNPNKSLWTLVETTDTNANAALSANERVFYIKYYNTNSCFDVQYSSTDNGTPISLYTSELTAHQKFLFPLM